MWTIKLIAVRLKIVREVKSDRTQPWDFQQMSVAMECGKPGESFSVFSASKLTSLENQNNFKFLTILCVFFSFGYQCPQWNTLWWNKAGYYHSPTMLLTNFLWHSGFYSYTYVIQLCILPIQNLIYASFGEKILII